MGAIVPGGDVNGDPLLVGANKTSAYPRESMHAVLLRLADDPASFFSIPRRNIVQKLLRFVNNRGRAPNLSTLRFNRVIAHSLGDHFDMISTDRNDNIIVPYVTDEVCVRDQLGRLVDRKIGAKGDHGAPICCVEDCSGRVFVSEGRLGCVRVFREDGSVERDIGAGQIKSPRGLALSPCDAILYVAAYEEHIVKAYNADTGAFVRNIGEDVLVYPKGVATLWSGQIAVSMRPQNRGAFVILCDVYGARIRRILCDEYMHPGQIAVDANENLYCVNEIDDNVVVFSADGRVLCCFGGKEAAQGCLDFPAGIAIDSEGGVVVSDGSTLKLFTSA
jgi:hypothetical protein